MVRLLEALNNLTYILYYGRNNYIRRFKEASTKLNIDISLLIEELIKREIAKRETTNIARKIIKFRLLLNVLIGFV